MAEQNQQKHMPLKECDIVMKGGITSGVVYPSAVLTLSRTYRFRNVGGASVGAIAAAVTAAAEFGRQVGKGTGFRQLEAIKADVAKDGFLVSLFKPRPAARGLYSVYLAAVEKRGVAKILWAAIRQTLWVLALWLAWLASLVLIIKWAGPRWWLILTLLAGGALVGCGVIWRIVGRATWWGPVGGFLLPLCWPVVIAPLSVGASGWRELSRNGFGLVGGASEAGDSVCDWLHNHIQAAAGLPDGTPLTFGMLRTVTGTDGEPAGIRLQMMTTDLSTSRPMVLPQDLQRFLFHPNDLAGVLPVSIIKWLQEKGTAEGDFFWLPPEDDLPVLLGFRLSLSFPVLFTATRLRAPLSSENSELVDHWFSDGGIGSNFPIQFFDRWAPRRPTFALSFVPFPADAQGRPLPDEPDIGLPPAPNGRKSPRWVAVKGLGDFAGQIMDTMQNWRDTVQSEIPGSRDRVYEARLDKDAGEGGLNLGMDVRTISRLQDRGNRVGEEILKTFDWDQHFFDRYLVAMREVERELLGQKTAGGERRGGLSEAFELRRRQFEKGDLGAKELFGHDATWVMGAGHGTSKLLEVVQQWSEFKGFASKDPEPHPVMRVVPDV
jgi:hypothetical protein